MIEKSTKFMKHDMKHCVTLQYQGEEKYMS